MSDEKTIFKKIIDREIPANIIFEDDHCIAFYDVSPQAPVHVLLIPKEEIENVAALQLENKELAGHLLLTAGKVARELGIDQAGYRVVANCGADGGQSVDHLHLHILAGRQLKWPPG
ncbi:MAG: histidine triad nucleotide-binding protein [Mariniblastus sp.]|nr:histidine triad nucleotide-binding protein [Mariniblastus sp.]